ncbi:inorganic phosphate transporter [Halorubrum sp. 2020YC2]|uniref:inorganic phosphate transporter n=1 Tax=Halorubrum sp. 2020YC2 TaxID=2836432 RepID=UPI001BE92232|nr:inorganic phosphate transporter [Halorubrum sp. 2020YC2]QWC18490.1 inorganic phosphate transporter family protein [Halorubrum sp. 2020YC2]
MVEILLLVGVAVAAFVGYNIGGATTGPAFGPAVGADVLSKAGAAALMSVFFFVGAGTLGQRVVTTLGEDLVTGASVFTLETSIIVLFFIGGALFIGNFAGVPASTSMTAVGSIAGLGIATNTLDWAVMGEIAIWWLVAPIIGFWVSGVVGRYFYSAIDRWVAIESTDGALFEFDRSKTIPRPVLGPNTTRRELTGGIIVIAIGCLMAFSSGTSNIANAIAPLVALDGVEMEPMILLGSAAVAVGAFTIARRTLDTLGNDITDLPLTAAIVVAVVSSGIVISLSAVGIPASFVIIATMSIVGLGWGRATRTVTVRQGIKGEKEPKVSVGALTADEMPEIGEGGASDIPSASDLFNPGTSARVVLMQNIVPILSTVGALVTFTLLFTFVWQGQL